MSSDNGVYVLETLGSEFRVAYAQSIDNIYGEFNDDTLHWNGDMDVMIDYFGNSIVYNNLMEAIDFAEKIAYNHEYLEYGVCVITDFKNLKFGLTY
jgi:hypothetical protein